MAKTDMELLKDERDQLFRALHILICNAQLIPDPYMDGKCDCYRVPLDDIDAAKAAMDGVWP